MKRYDINPCFDKEDYRSEQMLEVVNGEWVRYDNIDERLQNTTHNSDYAKCKIEAEIKRLEENPEGDYITRISALEWVLRIIAER